MTNKLLKKFSVDIFFILIGVLLIISLLEEMNLIDITYFGCVLFYYFQIRICRWKKCQ